MTKSKNLKQNISKCICYSGETFECQKCVGEIRKETAQEIISLLEEAFSENSFKEISCKEGCEDLKYCPKDHGIIEHKMLSLEGTIRVMTDTLKKRYGL